MKNPNKALTTLAIILLGMSFVSLLTPENSAAFPPADNQTPTAARTSARKPSDADFTLYLPLVFRPLPPIYLPFVARQPSPTPSNTPITPIANPVRNGGFEQPNSESGPWYAAIEYFCGSLEGVDLRHTLEGTGATPHDGYWASWLGGFPYGDCGYMLYLQQQLTIPVGGSTLRYWRWIQSDEPICTLDYDGAWVWFGTAAWHEVEAYPLCTSAATGGWVKREIDLSDYAGQNGWLAFIIRILGANSNLFIDDVALGTLPSRPLILQTPPARTVTPRP